MKETRIGMGMPIEIEVVSSDIACPISDVGHAMSDVALEEAFAYFAAVEERFSPFRETSEVSRINRSEISLDAVTSDMREVLDLGEKTRGETGGYFNVRRPDGVLNPSGIVKGWAIKNAAARIRAAGGDHFMVNAGGDIATGGMNARGEEWSVGIRNPFNIHEIVKVLYPHGKGVATSGSYIRGAHIYNPHAPSEALDDIVSITVIGPDVLEADRFATAAFAMGRKGIEFIEQLPGFEGYAIDRNGIATLTSGFAAYLDKE